MTLKFFRSHPVASLALLVPLFLLAGCVTTPAPVNPAAPVTATGPITAPAPAPAPTPAPVPAVEARPATITGSEEGSALFDDLTAYVVAVDGRPVAAGRKGWNAPLPLPAGPRKLTVEFGFGVFSARTVLQLTARPEAAYQLKFATDAAVFGKNTYCEFWIVDTAGGQTVAAAQRVALTRIAKPE